MAGVAPPAAPLPPVVAGVLAAPISDEMPVVLAATEPLVLATPCLEWTPVGVGAAVAQVSVPHWRMLRAFIARCSIGNDPGSLAMARATSLFLFLLNGAAWSRILTELRDSGLFSAVHQRMRDLSAALSGLVVQNPAFLAILAGDLVAGAPFNPPPAAAAVGRGRGRGRGVAAVGVPVGAAGTVGGPPELRFINLASLDKLVDTTDSSPMVAVAVLAGSLGPCSTQAIRGDELSTVRVVAGLLRALLGRGLDTTIAPTPAADPILAMQLRGLVIAAHRSLGNVFVAPSLNEFAMQQESLASYKYFLGTEAEKIAVETQCIFFVDDR